MPRLVPQLLKALAQAGPQSYRGPLVKRSRPRPHSLKKLRPPEASFTHVGRTQSVLLDTPNPIINPPLYTHHKSPPPHTVLLRRQVRKRGEHAIPREMTEYERDWCSNPYLRMLSSPLRRCVVTQYHLPSEFMIRLSMVRVPHAGSSVGTVALVPDGLLHKQFSTVIRGVGRYIVCCKDIFQSLTERGVLQRVSPSLAFPPSSEHIGQLLRLRVLQEVEFLGDQVQASPKTSSETTVCRRLTMSEWIHFKSTGLIPWRGAVAIIVVPPVNIDRETGKRPEPRMVCNPPGVAIVEGEKHWHAKPLPPLSSLHRSKDCDGYPLSDENIAPSLQIPLYNGLTLFPSVHERASLYAQLSRLLRIERVARWRYPSLGSTMPAADKQNCNEQGRQHEKASPAYVIFSDAETIKRGDSPALAIALWRVRLWEGGTVLA